MDVLGILGLIIAPVSSVVSWIFGTRSRRNTVYQELLATIKTLSEQNTAYNAKIVELQNENIEVHAAYNTKIAELQNEIFEVRKENAELKAGNAELKAGQEELTRQMQELKKENQELKELMTKNNNSKK